MQVHLHPDLYASPDLKWSGLSVYNRVDISKNYKGNTCNLRLEALKRDIFDFVREDEGFKRVENELERYAQRLTDVFTF